MKKSFDNTSSSILRIKDSVIILDKVGLHHFILFFSLLVFSYYIRGIFFPGGIKTINIIAIIAIMFIVYQNYKRIDLISLVLFGIISLLFLFNVLINQGNVMISISHYVTVVFPLLLLTITIKKENVERVFLLYVKIMNILVVLLLICGIIDALFENLISQNLALIFNDEQFTKFSSQGRIRYLSFMGHTLYTNQIFLMFYVINQICSRYYYRVLPTLIVFIITLIGIGLCASKTGMIIFILLMILLPPINIGIKFKGSNNKLIKNIVYYILLPLLFLLIFSTGILDNTLNRLTTGSLTTGRSESWNLVKQINYFPIQFFKGYGSSFTFMYNNYIPNASAAFEYPFRLFSLEYGQLFTIFMYINLFFIPFMKFIKLKAWYVLLGFLCIVLDINTYNGIGLNMDIMLSFTTFTYLLLNIVNSKHIDNRSVLHEK